MNPKLLGSLLVGVIILSGVYIGTLSLKQPIVQETLMEQPQVAQVISAPTSGLVGYYKFDDAGEATLINGATITTSGKIGGALSLSGGTTQKPTLAEISSPTSLSDFTVSAWVNGPFSRWTNALIGSGSNATRFLLSSNSYPGIIIGDTSNPASIKMPDMANKWTHITITRQGVTAAIYANGSSLGSWTVPTTAVAFKYIGGDNYWYEGNAFIGSIDEVRIYNRALSTSEISAVYEYTGPDLTAPSVPTNLVSSSITNTSAVISWSASTDPSGISKYNVYRNGTLVGSPTTNSYTDSGLTQSTTYTYTVSAVDSSSANNASTQSSPLSVTTTSPVVEVQVNQVTPPTTPTGGLILRLTLDNTSGITASDSSGSGYNGTLKNGPIWTTQAKLGGALQFDGTDDYVSLPNVDISGSAITISTWVNYQNTGSNQIFVGKPSSASTHTSPYFSYSLHGLYSSANSIIPRFYITTGGIPKFVPSTQSIPVNEWHHIVGVYDGSTIKIYVDGVQTGSVSASGNLNSYSTSLLFGINGGSTEKFKGTMDEVRIYNRVLSQSEISALYTESGIIPPQDTTAPVISSIVVVPTHNSATFTWTTNEASDSQVEYGLTTAYGSNMALMSPMVTSHSMSIVGGLSLQSYLNPNTVYHYRVKSKDAAGNLAVSKDQTFTTLTTTNQPPVISISATPTSATAPASIAITATASDPDGSISKVDFYNGTTLLSTDTTSPYIYPWTGVAVGTYSLTAKATDNQNAVSITVTPVLASICKSPAILSMGDKVKVTTAINARGTPSSVYRLNILSTQLEGITGTIVIDTDYVTTGADYPDPTCADGLWWWYVKYDNGNTGWSTEAYLAKNTVTANPILTIFKVGLGAVTTPLGSINCGTLCTYTGTTGQAITLTSVPTVGSTFTGWSGCTPVTTNPAQCSLTLNANTTVTATFDAVVIGLDTVPPVVTAFTIPSTSSVSNVPITSFEATDKNNIGELSPITGYLVNESDTKPLATASGWTLIKPSFVYTATGLRTFYAWVKDMANNISLSKSAQVDVTVVAGSTYQLPADRVIDWSKAGVQGGIPTNRTRYGSVIASGASQSTIQNTLNSAPAGTYVELAAGTYAINTGIKIPSNVTLRGAGIGQTILKNNSYIHLSNPAWNSETDGYFKTSTAIDLSGSLTKGATSIVTKTAHGWITGDYILIDRLPDPNGNPAVVDGIKSDGTATYYQCFVCGRPFGGQTGAHRVLGQWVKITSVPSATSVTIDPPLYITYDSVYKPQGIKVVNAVVNAGIQKLTIDQTTNSNLFPFEMTFAINSFVDEVNVKSNNSTVRFNLTVRGGLWDTISGSTIEGVGDIGGNNVGYGIYEIQGGSAMLISDNIFHTLEIGISSEGARSGDVIAYNYFTDLRYSDSSQRQAIGWHSPYNLMTLVEGNYFDGAIFASDMYFGNSGYTSLFRNRIKPNTTKTGSNQDIILWGPVEYVNIIGNILGVSGFEKYYEYSGQSTMPDGYVVPGWDASPAIYRLGYKTPYTNSVDYVYSTVKSTIIRHGNWDSVTSKVNSTCQTGSTCINGVVWDSTIGNKNLPSSLYSINKPSFFGNLAWPPYDPNNSVSASADDIPAGYRYIHGTNPPGVDTPTASISASPTSITAGQSATLSWSSTNATSCTAGGGWTGTKATLGTQSVTPTTNTTYSITCTGAGGTSTVVNASVSVIPPVGSTYQLPADRSIDWSQAGVPGGIPDRTTIYSDLTSGRYKVTQSTQTTTGSISTNSNQLTVASSASFEVGYGIVIKDAATSGSVDGNGKLTCYYADHRSIVSAVNGSTITLEDNAVYDTRCANVSGKLVSHDNAPTINKELKNSPPNQVVSIPAGTYAINTGIKIPSNVTLRGAGAGNTILNAVGSGSAAIRMGSEVQGEYVGTVHNIIGGSTKGSTSITLNNVNSIAVGSLLIVDQLNDSSVSNVGWYGTINWNSRENGKRAMGQTVEVKSISGNTVTFDPPLYTTYTLTPQAVSITPGATMAGLENLTVKANNTGYTAMIEMSGVKYSWVKGVETDYADGDHIRIMYGSYRNEIRNSYLHDGYRHGSGGTDTDIMIAGKSSGNLVENNILYRLHVGVMLNWGASGNVMAYNYVDGTFHIPPVTNNVATCQANAMLGNHGAHPAYNLFEGNIGSAFGDDSSWGSSAYNVYFRNWGQGDAIVFPPYNDGVRGAWQLSNAAHTTQCQRAFFAGDKQRNLSFIANVAGVPYVTDHDIRLAVAPQRFDYGGVSVLFALGYGDVGDVGSSDTPNLSTPAYATALFHANFDTVTNGIVNTAGLSTTIPNSLYRTTIPPYFTSTGISWPNIGPGVTSGIYAGIPAQMNPAMKCFKTYLATGTGKFDPVACYGGESVAGP